MDTPNLTKRYWIFVGNDYYPSGGLEDLYATVETPDEANEIIYSYNVRTRDWAHVVDVQTGKILVKFEGNKS